MLRFTYGLISGILICAIAYAAFNFRIYIDESDRKAQQAEFTISSINKAVERFFNDNGMLPSNNVGIKVLSPKYVDYVISDPWGNEYLYAEFKINGKSCYVVWSYGSDLKPGGENEAADMFMFGKNGNCL